MRASIDIGSNSTLLLVADYRDNIFEVVSDQSRITSLGRELDKNGVFHPESMRLLKEALVEYSEELKKYGISPGDCICTATEASRVAQNALSFFQDIKKELGLKIQTINAEGEAYYTMKGITAGADLDAGTIVVMDIGGASTELIKVDVLKSEILETVSLPVGAVRATEWKEVGAFEKEMSNIYKGYDLSPFSAETMICVAGTMVSFAAMLLDLTDFDSDRISSFSTSLKEFNSFFDFQAEMGPEDLLKRFPVLGKRAETILGGGLVAKSILDQCGVLRVQFSTRGLRYGALSEGKIDERFTFRGR